MRSLLAPAAPARHAESREPQTDERERARLGYDRAAVLPIAPQSAGRAGRARRVAEVGVGRLSVDTLDVGRRLIPRCLALSGDALIP